jgi:hypothetical protein
MCPAHQSCSRAARPVRPFVEHDHSQQVRRSRTPSTREGPMNDIIYASATALARGIRAKDVSSAEVVRAYLQRIEAVNPALNAVVQLCADAAQDEAKAADAALARGQITGPLHGVPMTIKDSLDTAGVITTGGTTGRASFVPAPRGQAGALRRRLTVRSGWWRRSAHQTRGLTPVPRPA